MTFGMARSCSRRRIETKMDAELPDMRAADAADFSVEQTAAGASRLQIRAPLARRCAHLAVRAILYAL